MSYVVELEQFQGPLDLLLKLIEAEELDITDISLARITEPYVQIIDAHRGQIPPEELADFLLVAAKLVYLKSRAILPGFTDEEIESSGDLEEQLKTYKRFVALAEKMGELVRNGQRSFSRPATVTRLPNEMVQPTNVSADVLVTLYRQVVRRLEPLVALPRVALERVVTIEEKIEDLKTRVRNLMHVSFHRFLAEAQSRHEMIVGFLALLELVKQRHVKIEQARLFDDVKVQSA